MATANRLPISGIPLFKVFGIQVFLHWSWILIAMYEINNKQGYSSPAWAIAEYLTLFAIVTLHEFGHALACRSVGGRADRIILWPLGGIAFVAPPPRPGAMLWSIAAGPLINVALLPIVWGVYINFKSQYLPHDVLHYLRNVAFMNTGLLIFNLLPIYPLDGGQIVRSLLWFVIGPAKSLLVASVIGLIGAGVGMVLAMFIRDTYLIVIAGFAAWQSWIGFQAARNALAAGRAASIPKPPV